MSDKIYHIYGPTDGASKTDAYCGNPKGRYMHLHFWLMDGAPDKGFCADCLASDELGLDLLSDKVDIEHAGRVRTHAQQTMKAVK